MVNSTHNPIKIQEITNKILESDNFVDMKDRLNKLHPAQLANLLESLPENKRQKVWKLVSHSLKGEILLEVHGEVARKLIALSSNQELIDALFNLQTDELIDLEHKIPKDVLNALIKTMDEEKRQKFYALQKYPSNTAGGLMDSDALSVRAGVTISVVLRYLRQFRRKHGTLPEHLTSISIVDRNNQYQGELNLVDLASLPANKKVNAVMQTKFEPIHTTTKAQIVARLFEDRDLLSAPVVDNNNKLVGRITIDDVVDYIRTESEHMILSPVGLSERTDLFSSIMKSVKDRLFWLSLNLINAFLASFVISLYSSSIEKIVVLAVLMPVIASMSGVIGNQTLTLVTRGLALSQITNKNSPLLLAKEAAVGLINGLIWAVVVGVISYLWYHQLKVSLIFSASMLLCILFAAVSGTLIPIILQKLNLDPAIAGGVMIVAISDILGFFIFLSFATMFLI